MDIHKFDDVTLLITHYNRSESLKRLLKSFQDLRCYFGEIIVSDDGSNPDNLKVLRDLQSAFDIKLLTTDVNKGLGHNINKGQRAVSTPMTLYVQEDFIPTDKFPDAFRVAVGIMKERKDFDIIRFYSYLKYPNLTPYKLGFSEMHIKPWHLDYKKIYFYSDHPHLRRSDFLLKFGNYAEGVKGDKTEYSMCVSFIKNKGKGLFYDDFKSLFIQQNSDDEPSTMLRGSWTQTKNPLISFIRYFYRQLKYNFDIYIGH